eukprot:gene28644-34582_t
MSSEEDKLKRLIAKEQLMRRQLGKEAPIAPSPLAEERKNLISPQSIDESRKRLTRLMGSKSPAKLSLSEYPSEDKARFTPEDTKRSVSNSSKSAKPPRLFSFNAHSLFGADDGAEVESETKGDLSEFTIKRKPAKKSMSTGAQSPILVRGGHYAFVATSQKDNDNIKSQQQHKKSDSKGDFETDDDEDASSVDRGSSGIHYSHGGSVLPGLQRTIPTSGRGGRDGSGLPPFPVYKHEAVQTEGVELQEEGAEDNKITAVEPAVSRMHKDSSECYEFIVKRHYDASHDLSALLADGFGADAVDVHETVDRVVAAAQEIVGSIDVTALQYWHQPSASASAAADRLVNGHSKKELHLAVLDQHRPHVQVMQGGAHSSVYSIGPSDEVFEDVLYVLKSVANSGATSKNVEYLTVVVIKHPGDTRVCLGLLIAAVASNIYHIYNPSTALRQWDAADEEKQGVNDIFLANAMLNIYQCNTYFESFQRLLCKMQLEKLAQAVDAFLREWHAAHRIDVALAECSGLKVEAQSKTLLLSLLSSVDALCVEDSPRSIAFRSSELASLVCSASVSLFPSVWVYAVKKESEFDGVHYQAAEYFASQAAPNVQTHVCSPREMTAELISCLQGAHHSVQQSPEFPKDSDYSSGGDSSRRVVRVSCKVTVDQGSDYGQMTFVMFAALPLHQSASSGGIYNDYLLEVMRIVEHGYKQLCNVLRAQMMKQMTQLQLPVIAQDPSLLQTAMMLQSKELSQTLGCKKIRLLLTPEFAAVALYGGVSVTGVDSAYALSYWKGSIPADEAMAYFSLEDDGRGSALWLWDLRRGNVVMYHNRDEAVGSSTEANSLAASRASLRKLIAEISPSFSSAVLVPLAVQQGDRKLLAALAFIDAHSPINSQGTNDVEALWSTSTATRHFVEYIIKSPVVAHAQASLQHLVGNMTHKEFTRRQEKAISVQSAALLRSVQRSKVAASYCKWRMLTMQQRHARLMRERDADSRLLLRFLLYRCDIQSDLDGHLALESAFARFTQLQPARSSHHFGDVVRDLVKEIFPHDQVVCADATEARVHSAPNSLMFELTSDIQVGIGSRFERLLTVTLLRSRGSGKSFSPEEYSRLSRFCQKASVVYSCLTQGTETSEVIFLQRMDVAKFQLEERLQQKVLNQLLKVTQALERLNKLNQSPSTSSEQLVSILLASVKFLTQCSSLELYDRHRVYHHVTNSDVTDSAAKLQDFINVVDGGKTVQLSSSGSRAASQSDLPQLSLQLRFDVTGAGSQQDDAAIALLLSNILLQYAAQYLRADMMVKAKEYELQAAILDSDKYQDSVTSLQQHLRSCAAEITESSVETKY